MRSDERVLILQTEEVGSDTCEALAGEGFRPDLLSPLAPRYERAPLEEDGPFDLLVLGSIHGWRGLLSRGFATPHAGLCVAVGARTARRVEAEAGPALTETVRAPKRELSEGILEMLGDVRGLRVLVPRSPSGRGILVDALREGGAEVYAPITYRMVAQPSADAAARFDAADSVIVGSGQILNAFLDQCPEAQALWPSKHVVGIGPVAAGAAQARGVKVDVVADRPDPVSLAKAIRKSEGGG